ncbi:MAG: hydrogenase formation protein HypD [Candidatus Hydrogenedentes bacterium]|nr:hydrogenase formation protein HypD [Candidatus Hydrogenedentota bacterium]
MKYIDEYRNPDLVRKLIGDIKRSCTREWKIMEVCGGQTHAFLRFGLDQALYPEVQMIHGPGCPVCVTPVEKIDTAIALSFRDNVLLCSFGDMLRVPGTEKSLLSARVEGAHVQTVYSPLDAVRIAQEDTSKEVVFFAVGFETTAPMNAISVKKAKELGLRNYSILCAQVLVPTAIEVLLNDSACQIDGFLSAGHVCTVMGYWEYEPIAEKYKKPIVVTGFEPIDLLLGVRNCVELLEGGKYGVVNAYPRSVRREGNTQAQALIKEVFEVCDRNWRGIGVIPQSGLKLKPEYIDYDAEVKFADLVCISVTKTTVCIAGEILQGKKKPSECPAFAKECTPENPLGAPMVSNEGACSAYYQYSHSRRD